MYSVVEFTTEGSVSVIRTEWITPKKNEVFWPPEKDPSKFEKLLTKGKEITSEWKLYDINRKFYATGFLYMHNDFSYVIPIATFFR